MKKGEPMAEESISLPMLKEKFPEAVLRTHSEHGDDTAIVDKGTISDVCRFLCSEPELEFNFLMDLTAVDRLHMGRKPRFEVVYHLYSLRHNRRLRLKTAVEEEDPYLDSVVAVWAGANWYEREVFDMFGIRFKGHPSLKRILMYEGFEGHPLRKDYPVNKRQPRRDLDESVCDLENSIKTKAPGYTEAGVGSGKTKHKRPWKATGQSGK